MFESGARGADGLDRRATTPTPMPATFEPHYTEIRAADQVQIYESVMGDRAGRADDGPAARACGT